MVISNLYCKVRLYFEQTYPGVYNLLHPHRRIFKYIISGGTAASVNIGSLFILTDIFGIYYLYSAIIAFLIAFWVSFFLQKLWTFKDGTNDKLLKQIFFYMITAIIGLGLNTVILYGLVEYLAIWYIFGQIIAGVAVALINFFIYRHVIFRV